MTLHPQYLVDDNQQPTAVLVPLEEWKSILAALEEFDDIRAYDQAMAIPQDRIPFDEAMKELDAGENV